MSNWAWNTTRQMSDLIGLTFSRVEQIDDRIEFETVDGKQFVMEHSQDCCESVDIESIVGDLSDLVGSPILKSEEVDSGDTPARDPSDAEYGSFTWTFYKLATIKGYVDIRWYGSSNGYYSESVDLYERPPIGVLQ